MGIETNYGSYVGKMDILSSLSTLSFDERRSEFFTNELLILLRLVENDKIDYKTLNRKRYEKYSNYYLNFVYFFHFV